MNTRLIIPIVVAAIAASAPALAANVASPACETLEKQFDHINPFHPGKNPTDEKARDMRKHGGEMCAAGKTAEGARMIRDSLAEWGVKPKA